MSTAKPGKLIFSIYGIRTLGKWQGDVASELEHNGWHHVPYKYGYFSLARFLSPFSRQRIIEEFHEWYHQQCIEYEPDETRRAVNRPSIVAHSFGSYVVAECMLKYREVKFDKILLCGSILPRSFNWHELLSRNQVWLIRNEFGLRDRWARIVVRLVGRMGDSGYKGFFLDSPCLVQEQFDYHLHSDYFRVGHCKEHWIPFFNQPSLKLVVRRGGDLTNEAEYASALQQAHVLSDQCYAGLPGYGEGLPPGTAASWVRVNPDNYTFLFDIQSSRLMGYINAFPLNEDAFRKIIKGKVGHADISAADLVPWEQGVPVWLYIMGLSIEPGARRIAQGIYQEAFERLIASFQGNLRRYYRRFGTQVVAIGSSAWTIEGQRLCESLGLAPRFPDRDGHMSYSMEVNQAMRKPGRLGDLVFKLKQEYQKLPSK